MVGRPEKELSVKQVRWVLPMLLMFASLGCPGGAEVRSDGNGGDWYYPSGDVPQYYDGPQQPDYFYPYPDGPPQQPDFWYWPPDTYAGSPFGCQQDSDCFGLKCCTTPWGVKLCAEVCEQ